VFILYGYLLVHDGYDKGEKNGEKEVFGFGAASRYIFTIAMRK
jgi:hypothetical protein